MTQNTIQKLLDAAMPVAPVLTVPPLVSINLKGLKELVLPPRELILSPWLPKQGLAMLHAYRGVGKTMLALEIAYAVATGGVYLKWGAGKPRRVLYLDGEMPVIDMQARLGEITKRSGAEPADPDFFQLINPDLQERGYNLATAEGQLLIEPFLANVDLLVIDSLATLSRSENANANDVESWHCMQDWLLRLRRSGLSVLFSHHDGKNLVQRGTSAKEDILDTVIGLRHPHGYKNADGARFEVHFEKNRGFAGDDAASFIARLSSEGWSTQEIRGDRRKEILRLAGENHSQRDIAEAVGLSAPTVNRVLKKAKLTTGG